MLEPKNGSRKASRDTDPATVLALDECLDVDTPARILLSHVLEERIAWFRAISDDLARRTALRVVLAYSVKTNTDERVLGMIAAGGFEAEVISQPELARAVRSGFARERAILNGPGKWWRPLEGGAVGSLYADSIADLRRIVDVAARGTMAAGTIGLRVAPRAVASRFGVDLADRAEFAEAVELLRALGRSQIGIHFHYAPMALGTEAWEREAAGAAAAGGRLARASGTSIIVMDLGGGWRPSALPTAFADSARRVIERVKLELPQLEEIVFEPGRALVEPAMIVVSRVLAVRGRGDRRSAVIDASIAELPDETTRSRPVLWRDPATGTWKQLGAGAGALLGRLCMEADIPAAGVQIPPELREGDLVALRNAGGYDHSMRYAFGQ